MPTLPATGSANWQDYVDYWREADAEWIQSRLVVPYDNATQRDADTVAGTRVGRLIYRVDTDRLELRSKTNTWIKYDPLPVNLTAVNDTSAQVTWAHVGAAGKGISYTPTEVSVNHLFKVAGGTLTVDATGVSIKTGSKTAKLTTDVLSLVSDSPISAPGATLSAALSGTSATFSGTVTAPSTSFATANVTGLATVGSLTTSGVITAAAAGHNISGVTFPASGGSAYVSAPAGFVSQAGYFKGDGSRATMQYRNPSGGALGTSSLVVDASNIGANGGTFYIDSQLLIQGNRSITWYGTNQNLGPNVWSAGDPGAANYPDGSLWLQP